MPWPRMTTRRMMIGVALIAVNWWAFEPLVTGVVRPRSSAGFLAIGLMPSFNLLAIGACVAIDQVRRRGEVAPFLVGFEAFGGAAAVASLVALLGYQGPTYWYFWKSS